MTKYQSFPSISQEKPASTERGVESRESEAGGIPPSRKEAKPLLYLNSNNSDRITPITPKDISDLALQTSNLLTNYHRKQAFTLALNVDTLVNNCESVNHVAFLTLTFPDHVTDFKEGSRRFDIFRKQVLDRFPNFGIWLRSTERQKSGRIHYHLLVQTEKDIRSGFDWEKYNKWIETRQAYRKKGKRFYGKCPTGNDNLREFWKIIMDNRTKYGFGMAEILPIRTNAEAMSKYVGKYISKHIGTRESRDKGMRLITYSQGWLKNSIKISWYSDGSREWRRKTQKFVSYNFGSTGNPDVDHYRMSQKFTKRWVWRYREEIMDIDFTVHFANLKIPF